MQPKIPALRRQRQWDLKFEVSLGYIARLYLSALHSPENQNQTLRSEEMSTKFRLQKL
jgi:hypothetical protein